MTRYNIDLNRTHYLNHKTGLYDRHWWVKLMRPIFWLQQKVK